MAKSEETISLPALGRPFQLGMLYDCRREKLIPGITLWDQETLQTAVNTEPRCRTDFDFITSESFEEKSKHLNLDLSLKASFLANLVEVRGSGTFLKDTRKSMKHAWLALQCSTLTDYKSLTMKHLGRNNISYPEVFEQGTATHVVTAVHYGAQAFFVFYCEASEAENVKDIQRHLEGMIKKVPNASGEAGESLKLNDTERKIEQKLGCIFHGDFFLDHNPTTFQEAMRVYATLPQLLGENREKAVPMKVWLYPLTKLDSKAARLVHEISVPLFCHLEDTLEKLTEMDARCNDLMKSPMATNFPEVKKNIETFQRLCQQQRQAFRKQISKILPSVRGGDKEEGALKDLQTRLDQSPFNIKRLTEFVEKKEQEMNMLKSFISILKDHEIVSSQAHLNDIVFDNKHDFVVSFTFTSLHREEPYLSELEQWFKKQHSRESPISTPAVSSSGKEKSNLWFQDEERKQKLRQAAKSFSDFANANKENDKTRFIVSSDREGKNPGASVYLYQNGTLVSKDFELPSTPFPPLIGEISHNCVQITFRPAAYGKAAILGYQMEYRRAGKVQWETVRWEGNQETYTVTPLWSNTQYTFRYAAMTKPGLSPKSEEIAVNTLPSSPSQIHLPQEKGGPDRRENCRHLQIESELRIALVGRTGAGKSATGNTILGARIFTSPTSSSWGMTKCQREETIIHGRKIVVLNTPGVFDTEVPEEEIWAEIRTCVRNLHPGPHAIIHVMRTGRLSQEQKAIAKRILDIFRLKAKSYMVTLFNQKDDLGGRSSEEALEDEDQDLWKYKAQRGGWWLDFDNTAQGQEREDQVDELLRIIDDLVERNKAAPYYTEEMLEEDREHNGRGKGACNIQ